LRRPWGGLWTARWISRRWSSSLAPIQADDFEIVQSASSVRIKKAVVKVPEARPLLEAAFMQPTWSPRQRPETPWTETAVKPFVEPVFHGYMLRFPDTLVECMWIAADGPGLSDDERWLLMWQAARHGLGGTRRAHVVAKSVLGELDSQNKGLTDLSPDELISSALQCQLYEIWKFDLGDSAKHTPLNVDLLIALHEFSTFRQSLTPLRVLELANFQDGPATHAVHFFLTLLQDVNGPIRRGRGYEILSQEQREDYHWIIDRVGKKAVQFFAEYVKFELGSNKRVPYQLDRDADEFLLAVSDKMFNLGVVDALPELTVRQHQLDAMGDQAARDQWLDAQRESAEASWVARTEPLPLRLVERMFGISVTERRALDPLRPMQTWQFQQLHRRQRSYKLKEGHLPTAVVVEKMVQNMPLRHRPFTSWLDYLYMSDYDAGPDRFTGAVHRLFLSGELVEELATYLHSVAQTRVTRQLQAPARGRGRGGVRLLGSGEGPAPMKVLFVGAQGPQLRHYMDGAFHLRRQRKSRTAIDVVVAAVNVDQSLVEDDDESLAYQPMPTSGAAASEQYRNMGPYTERGRVLFRAHAASTLRSVMAMYRPDLVVCTCMPPGEDWSASFRASASVQEYVLLGPTDSGRAGHRFLTWGQPLLFQQGVKGFGRAAAPPPAKRANRRTPVKEKYIHKQQYVVEPPFETEGFRPAEVASVSSVCLGTEDSPGFVGNYRCVAFRRFKQPKDGIFWRRS